MNVSTNDYMRIVERIDKISGSYHGTVIFNDWVEMTALAFSNFPEVNPKIYNQREKRYLELAEKHKSHIEDFAEMTAFLAECFETELDDYLGKIYMQLDAGNSKTGQFFTPFHISEMVAKAVTDEADDVITLNEPSCGGGAMIIAVAKALNEKGINYQQKLRVIAQDLSVNSCYMCYVQMSMLGINGMVIQGDTLAMKEPRPDQIYRTIFWR